MAQRPLAVRRQLQLVKSEPVPFSPPWHNAPRGSPAGATIQVARERHLNIPPTTPLADRRPVQHAQTFVRIRTKVATTPLAVRRLLQRTRPLRHNCDEALQRPSRIAARCNARSVSLKNLANSHNAPRGSPAVATRTRPLPQNFAEALQRPSRFAGRCNSPGPLLKNSSEAGHNAPRCSPPVATYPQFSAALERARRHNALRGSPAVATTPGRFVQIWTKRVAPTRWDGFFTGCSRR